MNHNESEFPPGISTLLFDCTACRDATRVGEPTRTADGTREWPVDYRTVSDPDHPGFDMREPVNEGDVLCPECGAVGRRWSY